MRGVGAWQTRKEQLASTRENGPSGTSRPGAQQAPRGHERARQGLVPHGHQSTGVETPALEPSKRRGGHCAINKERQGSKQTNTPEHKEPSRPACCSSGTGSPGRAACERWWTGEGIVRRVGQVQAQPGGAGSQRTDQDDKWNNSSGGAGEAAPCATCGGCWHGRAAVRPCGI